MRKRILVANDDGINAEGIITLAGALSKVADVVVVAPDRERSASSHSLTIHEPLRYSRVDFDFGLEAYAVNGTPADCVKFGLFQIVKDVDLVVSGINRGANLGSDIMYSGTVSAALEGAYLGYPAIAISVTSYKQPRLYYQFAADFLAESLDFFSGCDLPKNTILNINYPERVRDQVEGVRFCHMGIQEYNDVYVANETAVDDYWLSGVPIGHNRNKPNSDVELAKKGYITISPIAIDMTNYDALKRLERKGFKL